MKQIDLEPRDYRAEAVSAEPVFQPGGLVRLGWFGASVGVGLVVTFAAQVVVYWLISLFS